MTITVTFPLWFTPNQAGGLCECGCGLAAPLAPYTSERWACVKGEPRHFRHGHAIRIKQPMDDPANRQKIGPTRQGDRHYRWQGDRANYKALHLWLNRTFPKAGVCEQCEADVGTARGSGTQFALRPGRAYSRDRADYRELCIPCHISQDRKGQT